ncbi:hypothetical protein ACFQ4C_17935 [Larkinella insperata]|uniref:Uncharacterized protein n=1 Tax=Larkinella insperata TaxID=332158 RepID=A0ABW3Q717_9BACT|nr:hypothetical protein [Larkinella insperata]
MSYNQLLLCYFQQQPFVSLISSDDFKSQAEGLMNFQVFLMAFILDLRQCIDGPLLGDDILRNQLGFQMSQAQTILIMIKTEFNELTAIPK